MEGWHKGFMLRPLNPVSPSKQKGRHQKQHGNQTDHDSLGQNESQILSYAETHQHQNNKSDNRSCAAGQNRGQRFMYGIGNSGNGVIPLRPFLCKHIQQEYRVIHGYSQLQNRSHAEGQK